jgi:hypothetical protein
MFPRDSCASTPGAPLRMQQVFQFTCFTSTALLQCTPTIFPRDASTQGAPLRMRQGFQFTCFTSTPLLQCTPRVFPRDSCACLRKALRADATGFQFTCFTRTKVQILTLSVTRGAPLPMRQSAFCSIYLLYPYKSANTDTFSDTGGSAAYTTVRFLHNLLALLVQKCKY